VNSIKTKMTALGVPSFRYQIDTIASWSLRLCLAYPNTSGWKVEHLLTAISQRKNMASTF